MTLPPIAINVCMPAASFRLLDKHGMTNEQPQKFSLLRVISLLFILYRILAREFWGLIFGPGIFLGFRMFTPI